MKVKGRFLSYGAYALLILTSALLLLISLGFKRDGPTIDSVAYVDKVWASVDGGLWKQVKLPHSFEDLPPRTPVSVRASIFPGKDDGVYIKTVYAPAKVFFSGKEVFEFGKAENYPAFMKDPATEVHIIETHGINSGSGRLDLLIQFLSPVTRDTLTVHPPMVGTSKELIMERSRVLGVPLIFSLLQLGGGVLLILISLCISVIDKKGRLFLWLGLFSLSAGAWAFGENNFSGIIFRESTVLYLMSFIGLFTFIIPLLHFVRTFLDFEDPRPVRFMELICTVSAAAALLLQLFGLKACSESMYFFHGLLPVVLSLVTVLTLREYHRTRSVNALRLILPMGALALSAVVELFNYNFPFTYIFSSLFQVGILFFLLVMGVIAGLSIKDSVDLKDRQKALAFEQELLEIQVKEQGQRDLLLAQKEQQLHQQRHDLRHQLAAIQELAESGSDELQDYLRSLMDKIPQSGRVFCENRTVNGVISHYVSLCEQKGIEVALNLVVPATGSSTVDSDLCVIFGNLLENAAEACGRMDGDETKFVRINSSLQYDLLTITMDNSFNGKLAQEGWRFRSSKRNDFGVGLASIGSVAQKYGGDAEFRGEGKTFLSSLYLQLPPRQSVN